TPITDADAQRFEAARGNIVDLGNLTPAMRIAVDAFAQAVSDDGGQIHINSAFRPQAYQDHLRELWAVRIAGTRLSPNQRNVCAVQLAQIRQDFNSHGLRYPPARNSKHTQGLAIDANVTLPAGITLQDVLEQVGLVQAVSEDGVHFVLAD